MIEKEVIPGIILSSIILSEILRNKAGRARNPIGPLVRGFGFGPARVKGAGDR